MIWAEALSSEALAGPHAWRQVPDRDQAGWTAYEKPTPTGCEGEVPGSAGVVGLRRGAWEGCANLAPCLGIPELHSVAGRQGDCPPVGR